MKTIPIDNSDNITEEDMSRIQQRIYDPAAESIEDDAPALPKGACPVSRPASFGKGPDHK